MSTDMIPFEYALKDYMEEHPELTEEEARDILLDMIADYQYDNQAETPQ